jgi:uncharacterized protein (TIGR02611 family)
VALTASFPHLRESKPAIRVVLQLSFVKDELTRPDESPERDQNDRCGEPTPSVANRDDVEPKPGAAPEVSPPVPADGAEPVVRRSGITAGFVQWRDGVRSRRVTHAVYRVVVAVIGGIFVIGGLALVPLPGPGWLIVVLGLIVLASEFVWAALLLGFTRRTLQLWTDWVMRSPLWVRAALAASTAAFVGLILWALLKVTGIPDWVPDGWLDWVPGI